MTELSSILNLPDEDLVRQAHASIGGYVYQIFATGLAWLDLKGDDLLLVEVAEDYAVVADSMTTAVQVRASGRSRVTLRTEGVIEAIEALHRLRSRNSDRDVRAVYLACSAAGRERGSPLPTGLRGLDYWTSAAAGEVELGPLRALLHGLDFSPDLAGWLRRATDRQLRDDLVSRMTWRLGSPALPELARQFEDAVIARCAPAGLLASEGRRAAVAIFRHLLTLAASPGDRRLNRADLERTIEGASFVPASPAELRRGRREGSGFTPPLDLRRRDDSGGRMFFFAAGDRTPFVGRALERKALLDWARSSPDFSWTLLTGAGGMGKSRLALEVCETLEAGGWHVGFLSQGSAATRAERFADYRPGRPTLMVIDYVGQSPAWAGEVIRTIVDGSISSPFAHPVRMLLLERAGSEAHWWPVFTGEHPQRMSGRSARLGAGSTFLHLQGLPPAHRWAIVQRVAGPGYGAARGQILSALEEIDRSATPLFASLAAEAVRAGREIWQFDRQALLHDIFEREERRWRPWAKDEQDLARHRRAVALATMAGGLDLAAMAEIAPSDQFPFSRERFSPKLAAAMSGPTPNPDMIGPLEPDILGEWLVLDQSRASHPFDDGPRQLLAGAYALAVTSDSKASAVGGFLIRLAQDFPAEALELGLFEPPPEAPPSWISVWLTMMADIYEVLEDYPVDSAKLHAAASLSAELFSDDLSVQTAARIAAANYAVVLARAGNIAPALLIFQSLADWTATNPGQAEVAVYTASVGRAVGRAMLDQFDPSGALRVFEDLRRHAERFFDAPEADPEELQDETAHLGLLLRRYFELDGDDEAVAALNITLWGHPPSSQIDLARAAAQMLTTRSADDGLVDRERIIHELTVRARARPDRPEVAFWTANALFAKARDEDDPAVFIDTIRRLRAWIAPRLKEPDMSDVLWDAVQSGWITEDLELGRHAIEALFELWRASRDAVLDAGRNPRLDNHARSARVELEEALTHVPDAQWIQKIRHELG
jgi:hypothetical protein